MEAKKIPPLIKPKAVFDDQSPQYLHKRRRGMRQLVAANICYGLGLPRSDSNALPKAHRTFTEYALDPGFFGMNVCPSQESEGDAIQIQALTDLHVTAVRIDYSMQHDRSAADRFIKALLKDFRLTLHLVQDPMQASAMDRESVRADWRKFVAHVFEKYGSDIEAIEIGSTPNRHSWSGYTPQDYAQAMRQAHTARDAYREAKSDDQQTTQIPLLLGPNISDFAPYYNIGQMAQCHKLEALPDVATDNLFIDRVGAPERFDPHVLGKPLRGITRMNLIHKQYVLSRIARRFGVSRSWCTYTQYTLDLGQKRKRYVTPEKYMNYMVRQHVLTAAAGHFQRIYWGTLVNHYKGLIDEGTRIRPYPPFVHHRFIIDGPPEQWQRRERFFSSYAMLARTLKDTHFVRRWKTTPDMFVFEFKSGRGLEVVAWTLDGKVATLDVARTLQSQMPHRIYDREGNQLMIDPRLEITESPIYMHYIG